MSEREFRGVRPRGGKYPRLAVIVSVTSVLTVILLHGLPLLNLFFAVPLFFTLIAFGKPYFAVSAIASFALDAVAGVALSFAIAPADAPSRVGLAVFQSALLILPVVAAYWRDRARIRYCIAAAGVVAALAWLAVFLATDVGSRFFAVVREASGVSAEMFASMMPEGYDKVAFEALLSADALADAMTAVLRSCFASLFVAFYAVSYAVASRIAAAVGRKPYLAFDARAFFADRLTLVPLAFGMLGIIASRLFASRALEPLFWNVFCLASLALALQGYGIARFFLAMLGARIGPFARATLALALYALAFAQWPVTLSVLLIAGVLELFVPVRARFNNNDVADPTPGDGR